MCALKNMREAVIGVISDTHGLLRPEALEALAGCHLIVHAGDVGGPEILERLREVAPVKAVRGNTDVQAWARVLPRSEVIEVAGLSFYLLHDLGSLDLDPGAARFHGVFFGHSHRPEATFRGASLLFNPGSAGPRRSDLPVTVGRLTIRGGLLRPEIVQLLP